MKIHEYQAKEILRRFGVPTPRGEVTDDAAEAGYFAVRTALARSVSEASSYVVKKGIRDEAAPALVKLIARIAERFGVQVTQKAAAQAIPAIGAAGGAAINALFMEHFQSVARGHFIVRRLERDYGAEPVRLAYEEQGANGREN